MSVIRVLKSHSTGRVAGALAVGALVVGGAAAVSSPALTEQTPAKVVSAEQQRGDLPRSFAGIVEQVSPAVISIQVTGRVETAQGQGPSLDEMPDEMREFFEKFFGDRMPPGMPGQPGPEGGPQQGPEFQGAGSGFIVDAEGYAVTNDHVVGQADEIKVALKDGEVLDAEMVGRDEKTDLALIKIKTDKKLPHVNWGTSDDVRVGDWVVTVGNPFGLGHSVTAGIVSARGRTIGAGPYDDFLQIDAPINRGNSGGPAFDLTGKVVGVNTAIFSPSGGSVGIGFAIPSSMAQKVIAELKAHGKVERGWLGVHIQEVTPEIADSLGLQDDKGALVADVMPNGPAAAAGFKAGDLVLEVNGKTVKDVRALPRMVAELKAGSEAEFGIWRDGRRETLAVEIGKMPSEEQLAERSAPEPEAEQGSDVKGMKLAELDDRAREALGLDEGVSGAVVTGVANGSAAEDTGLQKGDVIVEAGGSPVNSPADVAERIETAEKQDKKAVLLRVKRGPQSRFVALPLKSA